MAEWAEAGLGREQDLLRFLGIGLTTLTEKIPAGLQPTEVDLGWDCSLYTKTPTFENRSLQAADSPVIAGKSGRLSQGSPA